MIVKGISYSSDRKLARCEMQYHYKYDEKIVPIRKKVGLFRGDLGHQLVQAHYTRPGPGWKAKFDELKKERWDKLFDEEKEDYGFDFMETLYDLMEHYTDYWAESEKNWRVIAVEKDFSILTKHGWPVRWKVDLLVEDILRVSTERRIKGHEQKRIILVEHKFKKWIPEPSERILQPQVHSYAWLLSKKGINVDTILWDYVRTEPVPRPQIRKDGNLSERKIQTDQRGYLKSLREAGIEPTNPDEATALQNKLDSLPVTMSLDRVQNSVNLKVGQDFVKDWVDRALRAEKTERPLRNWNYNCKFDCDYYNLCQVDMLGQTDRRLVLLNQFERSKREEQK